MHGFDRLRMELKNEDIAIEAGSDTERKDFRLVDLWHIYSTMTEVFDKPSCGPYYHACPIWMFVLSGLNQGIFPGVV